MTYSIVMCAAIGMDCTENIIPLLLFTGRCLIRASCCDSTILALSEYAMILTYLIRYSVSGYPYALWNYTNLKNCNKSCYLKFHSEIHLILKALYQNVTFIITKTVNLTVSIWWCPVHTTARVQLLCIFRWMLGYYKMATTSFSSFSDHCSLPSNQSSWLKW
jgi:hypothetical protein